MGKGGEREIERVSSGREAIERERWQLNEEWKIERESNTIIFTVNSTRTLCSRTS